MGDKACPAPDGARFLFKWLSLWSAHQCRSPQTCRPHGIWHRLAQPFMWQGWNRTAKSDTSWGPVVADLSRTRRGPVADLSRTCRGPVADPSRTCRGPVADLSRTRRGPVADLSRTRRGPVADLSRTCRGPVADPSRTRRGPVADLSRTCRETFGGVVVPIPYQSG